MYWKFRGNKGKLVPFSLIRNHLWEDRCSRYIRIASSLGSSANSGSLDQEMVIVEH